MRSRTRLDWINTVFLLGTPVVGVALSALWLVRDGFSWPIFFLAVFMYVATGISITAGYHRFLSHRAFEAHPIAKFLFLAFGAGSFQNSALKWCSDHRMHHAHEDGEKDPYTVKKGLFYAHMGWILLKEDHLTLKKFARDLEMDRQVAWQHKYYLPLAVGMGLILPTVAGHLLGSWLGGLALAGFLRLVVVHHATFSVNSFCHKFGVTTYNDDLSAKDNFWLAFVTYGEGHHNFHHAFPTDYRNGVRWFDFDPTKWTIKALAYVKLAGKLRTTPAALMARQRGGG